MRCPNCGALNPEDAQWCNQCLTSFRRPMRIIADPPEAAEAMDAPETAGSATSVEEAEEPGGPLQVRESGRWKCPVCEAHNLADANRCSTCGTDLFSFFGRKATPEPVVTGRSPIVAALLSVVPGVGHIFLARFAEGVGRLVLAIWWFGSAVFLSTFPLMRLVGLLFYLASLALVTVSMLDAYAAGTDPRRPPILSRTLIYYSSLGLLGILIAGSMITFVRLIR